MENFLNHTADWLILFALLGAGLYTMRVIRRESSSMRSESVETPFRDLLLFVPRWWTQTKFENNLIQFERTDTRYDWYARFSWIPDHSEVSLPDLLNQLVEKLELDYDKDDVVIETDSRVIFRDEDMQAKYREMVRVEGKASLRDEERIYLDMCIFRSQDKTGYYLCESRSSVLNGMVEGPFFEEVLAELEIRSVEQRHA